MKTRTEYNIINETTKTTTSTVNFFTLPEKSIILIANHLSFVDKRNLSLTNKKIYKILNSNMLNALWNKNKLNFLTFEGKLKWCIEHNRVDLLQNFLSSGHLINCGHLLRAAIRNQNKQAVKTLLDYPCINIQPDEYMTALRLASAFENVSIVDLLIIKLKEESLLPPDFLNKAICWCITNSKFIMFQYLIYKFKVKNLENKDDLIEIATRKKNHDFLNFIFKIT